MKPSFVLAVLALAACGQSASNDSVEALAVDPARLKALRQQCTSGRAQVGEVLCESAAEAFRQRFFAGNSGPDEYRTLADLPPIPPSFDEPVARETP